MQFGEIVAPTIKELFVKKVEDMILSGRLSIGDKLPTERELAEQMKISKTIINTGIKEMERKGFLEIIPRKGVFVANYAKNGSLETLTSIMQYNGGRLDKKNIQSILDVRLAIEVPAIEHVAKNRNDTDLKVLSDILDQLRSFSGNGYIDYQAIALLQYNFHHYIGYASGNLIIPLIFNAFKIPTLVLWEDAARTIGLDKTIVNLSILFQHIKDKDCDRACMILKSIITDYLQLI